MKLLVILGSTRPQRNGEHVADWIRRDAEALHPFDVDFADLRDFPLPNYDEALPPKALKGAYANEVARRWVKKVGDADAYLVIVPEYNHGYPAVLKNALDYPYDEWNNKPIAFVSYGAAAGGVRAVEQLRQVAIELQLAPIRNAVHIADVWQAFTDNGEPINEKVRSQLTSTIEQLAWWSKALRAARIQ